MKIDQRNTVKTLLFTGALLFLFVIRGVLTPFILAAILAYILNPSVRFLSEKLHIPRTLSVVTIYILVAAILVIASARSGILLARESRELGSELSKLRYISANQLSDYPDWLRFTIMELAANRELVYSFTPTRLTPYFSGALSGIVSTLIFLVSGFYFLKDGDMMIRKLIGSLPPKYRKIAEDIFSRTSTVLNDYLRGQIFLVFLMAVVSFIVLSLLHVRYALTLGIFTGIAEIVPIVGPVIAGAAAVLVAIFDGINTLNLPPLMQGLVVALAYFILREAEDILIIPVVLGKATKLHPFVVLFAVVAGAHLWGILGMILAVPVTALFRTLLEYYLETNK
ncbi:AI-2E family transporter [Patescibacteria group bacterium]|nr:AI-2E family transporter [Patescibacteria group bacterium]MCL5798425.1 AI-2E family transporter [Patescibacteria group bacterium]